MNAAKAGKKAISLMNGVVDTAVLIVILLLVIIGCYALWDSKQVFDRADAAHYDIYHPTPEDGGKSFAELRAINPDVFGWITIYGTHIDYPVVHGTDNMTYVNTNAEGEYSLSGSIFLDYRCSEDLSDFSSIFYGHHMEKSAMFGDIGCFSDQSYFDERPYGMLYYEDQEHGVEHFAFVHADAYDSAVFRTNITEREERQAYLDMLLEMASHTRDVEVTIDDRIALFSTCSASSTNGRDILVGKITDEIYDDPFALDEQDNVKNALAVDGLPGLWAQTPLWGKIAIVIVPLLLLILLSITIKNRKRSKKREDKTPY